MPTGEAAATTGGALKAKKQNCLLKRTRTASLGLKTISFPSISTGAYGYPVEKASLTALMTVLDFLRKNEGLAEVRFVLHTQKDLLVYEETRKRSAFEIIPLNYLSDYCCAAA